MGGGDVCQKGSSVTPVKLAEPRDRKTCLLVLGMHRSGTSALTGTLGLMGAALPELLVLSNKSNVKGHFESLTALELNEDILAAMNSCWHDIASIEISDLDPIFLEEWKTRLLAYLRTELSKTSLFVLKDPRLSRILPLAVSVLRDLSASSRAIICLRHPLEVARSLERRDGIAPAHGIGLWLRYMLDAELNSRDLVRIFLDYSALLQDWRSTIHQIEEQLGVVLPKRPATAANSINEFLDKALRHNFAGSDESKDGLWSYSLAITCYQALTALTRNPNDQNAMHKLDLIRSKFDEPAFLFGAPLKIYFSEIRDMRKRLKLQSRTQAKVKHLSNLNREMRASTSWRLTAPLRKLGYILHSASRLLK